ncbi:hypothetical protein J2Z32_001352 [Paenibacillus turicensis]|uniref:Uncharacterized protein n=1 Tax=Paenibacillus turicensis TaxID=160487 RepID=A0ABS4FQ65_9BACL|nr:hypothetical protein [Paenibacillus turicensis]MBP1904728.1 hypothetical protein [Paenibacillus turicensis]
MSLLDDYRLDNYRLGAKKNVSGGVVTDSDLEIDNTKGNGGVAWVKSASQAQFAKGVVVDDDRSSYWVCYNSGSVKKIIKLDVNGTEVWSHVSTNFNFPSAIARDGFGNIYVALNGLASSTYSVIKLRESDGGLVLASSEPRNGLSIAVDEKQNVYVGYEGSTGGSVSVAKYNSGLAQLWQKADLPNCVGMAVKNDILVCSHAVSSSERIRRLSTSNGNRIWGRSETKSPRGITIDEENNVYVCFADNPLANNGITVIDGVSGSEKNRTNKVGNCQTIKTDSLGRVYVGIIGAAIGMDTVVKMDKNWNKIWGSLDLGQVYGIDVDSRGDVYCAHFLANNTSLRKLQGEVYYKIK